MISYIFQPYGIRMAHLSLLDEGCKPQQNSTHFVFYTQLRQCDTIMEEVSYGMSFKNAIVVKNFLQRADDLVEGSGDFELDLDETRVDDEDYVASERPLVIAFECPYHTNDQANDLVSSCSFFDN